MFFSSKNTSTLMSSTIRHRRHFYRRLKSIVTWCDVYMFHQKRLVFCTLYNILIKKITKNTTKQQATRVATHLIKKNCHPGRPAMRAGQLDSLPRGHLPKVPPEGFEPPTSRLRCKAKANAPCIQLNEHRWVSFLFS